MQFLVIGRDGDDAGALDRRMAVRNAHIALGDEMAAAGTMLFAVAILSEGQMVGSMIVVDFESRSGLDDWLKIEPYVTGDVWRSIEIEECRVGPSFVDIVKKK